MMGLASSHDSLAWANTAPAACSTLKRSNFLTLINHLTQKPDEEIDMAKILICDRRGETVLEAARPGCGTVSCIKWLGVPLQDGWNLFYGLWSGKMRNLKHITKSEVLAKLRDVAETGVV